MSSSAKMEDLLPHTTADMVAPAALRRRRSVRRRSQPCYSPPPRGSPTIWPVGIRPVALSTRNQTAHASLARAQTGALFRRGSLEERATGRIPTGQMVGDPRGGGE